MVEADTVERVEQGKLALDLMRLDHGLEDVAHGQRLALAREVVGDGEDRAEVVRGVSPLGREPAVVEVEPTDHGANVEGAENGVELVGGTGNFCAIGYDSVWDNGTELVGALLEAERLETTAEGVNEDPAGSVILDPG